MEQMDFRVAFYWIAIRYKLLFSGLPTETDRMPLDRWGKHSFWEIEAIDGLVYRIDRDLLSHKIDPS
jgi:hypothetical protein